MQEPNISTLCTFEKVAKEKMLTTVNVSLNNSFDHLPHHRDGTNFHFISASEKDGYITQALYLNWTFKVETFCCFLHLAVEL